METAGNESYHSDHMGAIFKEGFSFSGYERDFLALNLVGRQFLDISGISGIDSISDGRGSVFADFDNDGDLDIFLTAVQGEAHFLFRNNVGQENGFVRVELQGTRSGRDAFGSVVRVKTSSGILTKIKAGGSGFLSQHDPRLLFGLGADTNAEWVEVTWPDGTAQRFEEVPAGSSLRIVQGSENLQAVAERRFRLTEPLSPADSMLAKLGFRKGEPFPDMRLLALDRRELRLRDLYRPGRRTLVNFWATYCLPCQNEMPTLQALAPRLRESGIDLVGVSIDLGTADQVPKFLEDYGITYSVYTTGEESVSRVFSRGEVMIPVSFLLDEEGRLLEVLWGWTDDSRGEFERLVTVSGSDRGEEG